MYYEDIQNAECTTRLAKTLQVFTQLSKNHGTTPDSRFLVTRVVRRRHFKLSFAQYIAILLSHYPEKSIRRYL